MLHFGFVRKIMLITCGCFSCSGQCFHTAKGPPLCLLSCSAREEVGDAHDVGRGNVREGDPSGPKGYSLHYDTMLSNKS